jgi:hypothetical protein
VLVDHADAGLQRGLGVAWDELLAIDADGSGVGAVVAEEDRHQRALAGAVLAEQGEDFPATEIEADVVVGRELAEAFGDAGDLQQRRGFGGDDGGRHGVWL